MARGDLDMPVQEHSNHIDFTVDQANLYREEAYTDLRAASIRRLVPVLPDGSEDKSRTAVFIGTSQLMSPQGPLPLQAALPANTFKEAMEVFPRAMQQAMADMIEEIRKLQEEEKREHSSRIIVPGR
jgi:hypothetical protein